MDEESVSGLAAPRAGRCSLSEEARASVKLRAVTSFEVIPEGSITGRRWRTFPRKDPPSLGFSALRTKAGSGLDDNQLWLAS